MLYVIMMLLYCFYWWWWLCWRLLKTCRWQKLNKDTKSDTNLLVKHLHTHTHKLSLKKLHRKNKIIIKYRSNCVWAALYFIYILVIFFFAVFAILSNCVSKLILSVSHLLTSFNFLAIFVIHFTPPPTKRKKRKKATKKV